MDKQVSESTKLWGKLEILSLTRFPHWVSEETAKMSSSGCHLILEKHCGIQLQLPWTGLTMEKEIGCDDEALRWDFLCLHCLEGMIYTPSLVQKFLSHGLALDPALKRLIPHILHKLTVTTWLEGVSVTYLCSNAISMHIWTLTNLLCTCLYYKFISLTSVSSARGQIYCSEVSFMVQVT